MPQIPVFQFQPKATPASNVRADQGMYDGVGAAGRALGAGIASLGNAAETFAYRAQKHVDEGNMAAEQVERMKVAADIEAIPTDPKFLDTPDKWAPEVDRRWKAYDAARSKRAANYSQAVQRADMQEYTRYREKVGVQMAGLARNASLLKAQRSKENLARANMMAGDWQAAVDVVNTMDLTSEAKAAKVQEITSDGLYHEYDRRLSDISTLTNVEQKAALAEVERELGETDANGAPVNGVVVDDAGKVQGALMQHTRTDLIRQTRARMKAVDVAMVQTGKTLTSQIKLGGDPATLFAAAYKAGDIDQETAAVFVPEVNLELLALKEKAEAKAAAAAEKAEAKAEREAAALAVRRDRAEASATAELNRPTGTRLTMDEIERREARGIARPNDPTGLTAEAAARLRSELSAMEAADLTRPDVMAIQESLDSRLGRSMFFTRIADKAQMAPAEKSRMLERINGAKISAGAKVALMDRFFAVQEADLRESEITDRDGDRQIGPEEKNLRAALIATYRENASALGARALGARYMADSEAISQWARANPDASPQIVAAKMQEFYEKMARGVSDAAGSAVIQGLPMLQ